MFGKNEVPKSIDFLKPVTRPDDIWANAYQWLFEVGKYMLIVVEIVTLGVFVARFIMDERNNDLTEDINSQVQILSGGNWKQDSITYENLQTLLADIKRIDKDQKINSVTIEEIQNGVPGGLTIETFSFSGRNVSLNLKTTDFISFKDYETAIKNNEGYENVTFSTVKDDTIYDVRVNFTIAENQ